MSPERLRELADSPALVFSTYILILAPLALYVYHDILDTRWRPVWCLVKYLIAYVLLYIVSGAGLVAYIVIQAFGEDYKEVGASCLALILGTYGAWKLIRLARIMLAHRGLVKILQRIDAALCKLTGLKPVGLEYHLFRKPQHPKLPNRLNRSNWNYETRHDFISSSLFDDDYPGEAAARIRWLAFFGGKVVVLQDDADECASRVGLWMRLVLRRPRSEPWRLLTSTSPLVHGHLYRVSLGEALRALITHGSAQPPPAHAQSNPAEVLLNGGSLTEVGVGFFWIASEMGTDEMTEVLAEMPPRWMRGVTQNGKQLMFELVMSLVLCEMPDPEDDNLSWILSLPVLQWKRDVSNLRVWSVMAEICADAIVCVMPRYTHAGEMPPEYLLYEIVKKGVFELQAAMSDAHGFQGDIVGLSLIELIRASYRAGYLTEKILGKDLQGEIKRNDWTTDCRHLRLFKAEIVTGLFSILSQLGQDDNDPFKKDFEALKKEWGVDQGVSDVIHALQERAKKERNESFNLDIVASSRCWFLGDRTQQCEDPASAFATVSASASELVPFVLHMLQAYIGDEHIIRMSVTHGDPDKYREQWISWKTAQAHDISGSTEGLNMGQLRSLNSAPRDELLLKLDP